MRCLIRLLGLEGVGVEVIGLSVFPEYCILPGELYFYGCTRSRLRHRHPTGFIRFTASLPPLFSIIVQKA